MLRKPGFYIFLFLLTGLLLICGCACAQEQELFVQEPEPIDDELVGSIEEQNQVEVPHPIKSMIEEVYYVTDITEVIRDLSADDYFLILVIYDKEKFERHINTEAGSFYNNSDSKEHFPQIVAGDGSQCQTLLIKGDSSNVYMYYLVEQGSSNFSIEFRELDLLDLSQYNPVTVDKYSFD